MRAAVIEKFNEPWQVREMPNPKPAPGQVVIRVHASGMCFTDVHAHHGVFPLKPPFVAGHEPAGEIVELGAGVTDLKVGDPVFGVLDAGQEGAYAEKVAVKAAIIAKKPDGLSHTDAAALALTGLTALVSVEDTLKLQPGETILIQGGAGGVASFAIQIAKHIGAKVITTTSTPNVDYVRGLGPDQIIDYKTDDFTKVVKDVDAVFETVGGDVAAKSFEVVKSGGRAAFIASGGQAPKSPRPDVTSLRPAVGRTRRHMERVADLCLKGAVKPPEIKLYKLSDIVETQRVSEGRHFRGKLVFKVR
jgi:NADPH:quinone reductase-like Zn-dependent oxidoreductase